MIKHVCVEVTRWPKAPALSVCAHVPLDAHAHKYRHAHRARPVCVWEPMYMRVHAWGVHSPRGLV